MSHDPLDIIAESYRGIQASTQVMAEATVHLRDTQARLAATQRSLGRLQGLALGLLIVALVGIGGLLVFASLEHRDHVALVEALRVETKALAILLERMPTP